MKSVKYAIVVEMPGYSDISMLGVVSGRRDLFRALRDEIENDADFYWNKRLSTLAECAKYGGPYYGHHTGHGVSHTLSVWILTDRDAQRIESEIDGGLW